MLCYVLVVYSEAAAALELQCEAGDLRRIFLRGQVIRGGQRSKFHESPSRSKKTRNPLVLPTSTQQLVWTPSINLLLLVSKVKSGLKMLWHKGVGFGTRTTCRILVCWIWTRFEPDEQRLCGLLMELRTHVTCVLINVGLAFISKFNTWLILIFIWLFHAKRLQNTTLL